MNSQDFFEIWLQSALSERREARSLRRFARRHESSREMFLASASRAYSRALSDLRHARRFRSEIHAS